MLLALRSQGWIRLACVAIAVGLAWLFTPRPHNLTDRGVAPTSPGIGALSALADSITAALSLSRLDHVAVGSRHSSYAMRAGWRRHRVLVVGLPQWLTLSAFERIALIASEAARLEARRGPMSWLTTWADDILTRMIDLTLPASRRAAGQESADAAHRDLGAFGFADDVAGHAALRDATDSAGAAGMALIRRPLRWVQQRLRVSELRWLSASLPVWDLRVRQVSGSPAFTAMLLSTLSPPRGVFAAARAARTGQDPLTALEHVEPPTDEELEERWRRALALPIDSRDGQTARRLAWVGYPDDHDADASGPRGLLAEASAADDEIRALRPQVLPVYRDLLLTGDAEN